ncbi:helix-turn-helix domain-containing protein [Lysinibacillus sp. LZ02]|uniref:helix-turn-helix domain-containing protein n=1 Tax=Lysinibacillus sp. LZ02 TaxID=3420668 RepID=UPI003D36E956
MLQKKLILFFLQDHITFLTNKIEADFHQHHYIQVTLALDEPFTLEVENQAFHTVGAIIDSNKAHKLHGTNGWQLYLLVNPESIFGEDLRQKLNDTNGVYIFQQMHQELLTTIHRIKAVHNHQQYDSFLHNLKQALAIQVVTSQSMIDSRIQQVLDYIKGTPLEEVEIKRLSRYIYLSESRLSHLFKQEMGISLTSYLLHEKIKRAFQLIFSGESMTDAAIEAGFNSSSHFTRSAKEKLGMTPSAIKKDSIYLKV